MSQQASKIPSSNAPGGVSTLFLPLREPFGVWSACAALALFYAATMARDLSLYDSGELALAAVQLGLGHPPGQPLHTLLGFGFAHLKVVTPLVGVGLLSVIPGALALVPAACIAQRLAGPDQSRSALRAIPCLLVPIAMHPALWEPATRVEVYALATFFALWAVARLVCAHPLEAGDASRPARDVLCAAIALGLCACVNPMIALCTGLAVAPAILWAVSRGRLPVRALGYALLGGVLGLLPYLYVPLIARRSDVMIWGAPRDAHELWRYLTLHDYAHNQQITALEWCKHALLWLGDSLERGLGPVLGLGIAGQIMLGGRSTLGRSAGPLLLGLLVAAISFNVVWNLDVPDYDGYTACALWLAAAGAVAFCVLLHALERRFVAYVVGGVLMCAGVLSPPAAFMRTRQRDHLARELAERVLAESPAGGIAIANADHFAGSLFYLQEIERRRPDVIVLAYGLASSNWHWDRIYQRHPELVGFVRAAPGGRAARVRRFIAANAARPLLIEDFALAAEIGVHPCPGGLYLRAGSACGLRPPNAEPAAALLARNLAALGYGSPSAAGAIAQTAYGLGESLWRLGYGLEAYRVLLAGVPPEMLSSRAEPAPAVLERVAPLAGPLPNWRRNAALGDPARNLFVVAALLHAAGAEPAARACLRAAAQDGLPEAQPGR